MLSLKSEEKDLVFMINYYCKRNHASKYPCEDCLILIEYAKKRLSLCTFKDKKPVCAGCRTHCYSKEYKEKIKRVMRFSGPRMVFVKPGIVLRHLIRMIAFRLKRNSG